MHRRGRGSFERATKYASSRHRLNRPIGQNQACSSDARAHVNVEAATSCASAPVSARPSEPCGAEAQHAKLLAAMRRGTANVAVQTMRFGFRWRYTSRQVRETRLSVRRFDELDLATSRSTCWVARSYDWSILGCYGALYGAGRPKAWALHLRTLAPHAPLKNITVVALERRLLRPSRRASSPISGTRDQIERGCGDFGPRLRPSVHGLSSYFVWLNRSRSR